uniref:Uncharacterized protein n=1 Tax=Avena sativa TaxID=4498 RepID=A0ACD5ZF85_AVESA
MADSGLCKLFADDCESWQGSGNADDLFSILETWEQCINGGGGAAAVSNIAVVGCEGAGAEASNRCARPTPGARRREADGQKFKGAPVRKKHKGSTSAAPVAAEADNDVDEGAAKMTHITVERNRRKQMNENLAVLRMLMPCFYVKRGDQASVIGGVVDYIKELQQVLHSLEAKKHRKVYVEQVLSPRPVTSSRAPSPRPLPLSPRPFMMKPVAPPLSPRLAVPISPGTPTPGSPYKPCLPHVNAYISPAMTPTASSSSSSHTYDIVPRPYLPTLDSIVTELAAARPAGLLLPDVKVEFAGPNLVLKTLSHRAPGQVLKVMAKLESLSLEILHVSISAVDDTMVHSFTIKIGIECELSAEELVHEIQQTIL